MNEELRKELEKCGCALLDRFLPRLVVSAQKEDDLMRLVMLAGKRRMRICPMGTGSSFPATYRPPTDMIFLLTTTVNRVVEVRAQDAVIIFESGILTAELNRVLEGSQWTFPPAFAQYPGTMGGALLSADSQGARHLEFKRRLLGVEMIDPRGRLLKLGSGTMKNVAGYDFWTFLVGTGGRFGILTKITLNLENLPLLDPSPSADSEQQKPEEDTIRWIYANLEKKLDPDGIFTR